MKKKLINTVVSIFILCVTFYAGNIFGFYKGFNLFYLSYIPTNVAQDLLTIKKIKNNNSTDAIKYLEAQLDINIIQHHIKLTNRPHIRNVIFYLDLMKKKNEFNSYQQSIMQKAAIYRLEYAKKNDKVLYDAINYYLRENGDVFK